MEDEPPAHGVLVIRASGAATALAALADATPAISDVQLVMRATMPRRLPVSARRVTAPGCAVELRAPSGADVSAGVVVLTVAARRLSIDAAELQPLMFQQVAVQRPLETLFSAAVTHLLGVAPRPDVVDQHGVAHYLTGLAELVLRSVLNDELRGADTTAARYREAIRYVKAHLADPELTAERVAEALFISRRRLYQLFDGDGISGRIRRMRIERAQDLLADPAYGSRGIGELARMCGFVNPGHFSRTFHRIVGRTPREYRDSVVKVDGPDEPPEHR